jgi:predicted phage baseplate assembly protein
LTTLLTRPLGVQGVTNPAPSSGGQDAETLSDARKNAPLRVLTLDRAVSVEDYADFARTFAGIAKALAVWIGDGRARGIHLTVAGPNGAAVAADTTAALMAALRRYGDALLPLSVASYAARTFRLAAKVKPAADADGSKVLAAVEAALRNAYSFDLRDFGQPVTIDVVYAVIQDVAGVVAADIRSLYRSDTGALAPQPSPRLLAALPAVGADGSVSAAELLTLHPAPLELGVMT